MSQRHARLRLVLAVIVMGMIWLVVLPRLSSWAPIRNTIRSNEAAGIDPSAMFYSDLEHLSYRDGMLRHRDSVPSDNRKDANQPAR